MLRAIFRVLDCYSKRELFSNICKEGLKMKPQNSLTLCDLLLKSLDFLLNARFEVF